LASWGNKLGTALPAALLGLVYPAAVVTPEREHESWLGRSTWLLAALVGVDVATKVTAYLTLEQGSEIQADSWLQLGLRTNAGLGSWGRALLDEREMDRVFCAGFGFFCAGVILLRNPRRKLRAAGGAWIIGFVLALLFADSIASWSAWTKMFVLGCGRSVFFVGLWRLVTSGPWKRALTALTAAALGNFLSSVYPPFEIVDFIYSAPVSRLLGVGVMNLADYYYDAGLLLLILALADVVWRRFISRSVSSVPSRLDER
jgi:lipoprotein signal peptidase